MKSGPSTLPASPAVSALPVGLHFRDEASRHGAGALAQPLHVSSQLAQEETAPACALLITGADMTVAHDGTAGGHGGDGDGLPVAAADARMKAVSGSITARRHPDAPLPGPGERLLISRIVIESSGRPRAVVGASLSGKSPMMSRERSESMPPNRNTRKDTK